MRLLLDRGAAIEAADSLGRTPLFWAAGRGHKTVVRLLLDKGVAIRLDSTVSVHILEQNYKS